MTKGSLQALCLALLTPLAGLGVEIETGKPAWLTELSVQGKLGYDDNIFGVSTNLSGRPDIAGQEAWVLGFGLKAQVDLVRLLDLDKQAMVKGFTLAYAPDYTRFDGQAQEDNTRHFVQGVLKAKVADWSLSLDNSFLYVDGSREAQFLNTLNSYSFPAGRERREQLQDRLLVQAQHEAETWFFRACFSVLWYDLLTERHQPLGVWKGYLSYIDRSEVFSGFDLGCKANKDLTYTVGWRYGVQTQDRQPWGGTHNPGTFHRLLFGVNGKVLPWLKLQVLAGPEFHHYNAGVNRGTAKENLSTLFLEGSATASLGKDDSLSLSSKVWQWVASAGSVAYLEATHNLVWKHNFGGGFWCSAGLRYLNSRYEYPAIRNDYLLGWPLALGYQPTAALTLGVEYVASEARSRSDRSLFPGRDFEQTQTWLTAKYVF